MWRTIGVLLVVAVWCFQSSHSLVVPFKTHDDDRGEILLGSFGFKKLGYMQFNISDFKTSSFDPNKMFFVLKVDQQDIEEYEGAQVQDDYCKLSTSDNKLSFEQVNSTGYELHIKSGVAPPTLGSEGLYNLFFINCQKVKVSFKMLLTQYNVVHNRKDFLSVGLSPLPTVYGVFSVVYFILFFIWVLGYMRGQGSVLNKIHYLMTILVLWKFLSLVFYAIDQHHLKTTGIPDGWAIAYYVFAVLKTVFFFVIVTLIGTGWSFFKPFLSDKDKKIIMVVIPLQVLDNVAMVIIGTNDPGAFGLLAWKDIFRLVDIICCGAILIPIIWSIKHLREASQSDGKGLLAARNLQKLKLFRQFYLIVVSYIYFTRIIIYLLDAALPFYLLYLGDVCTEAATLCFFMVVGYKFRPMPANPYFNVEEEDAARLEEMRAAAED